MPSVRQTVLDERWSAVEVPPSGLEVLVAVRGDECAVGDPSITVISHVDITEIRDRGGEPTKRGPRRDGRRGIVVIVTILVGGSRHDLSVGRVNAMDQAT